MIEFCITDDDGLNRARWVFWLDGQRMRLHVDLWAIESRTTKRHKWRASKFYSRLSYDVHSVDCMGSKTHPELTDDLKRRALEAVAESITFVTQEGAGPRR